MATVELENIKKRFGKTEVLHGVSIDIQDGEFIVIVGPSGCGKSTLLRMVAGLESISEGEIRIGEARVNEREPMDRDIAMVFQNYALYPHMSVRQNMGYGLKIAGMSKSEIKRRVDEAAKLLQLSDYLERKPRELSGGQRQRVAMGRAIVREPSVFLFDEPLSNLDAKLRVQMRVEIRELQRKLGVTALYVTHDQVEAMTMADRMIVMNGGVAEQIGTPLEVYERPVTIFAAQFIGSPSMNVIDAEVRGGRVMLGHVTLGPTDLPDRPVSLGIRPEHLHPDDNGPLTLNVTLSEPLGANTLLHGTLEGRGEPMTAALPGVHMEKQAVGQVRLSVNAEDLHLFDPKTGKRLN
ncbi:MULTISPECIES: ABC transporter ATP-binding protein [Thioclava]|uniref:Sn-glycerol-3-phosphate ABC transporter ATP-binding protein UgpC n=1 Tax=Thioclava nitratireducens TaxID=1915078 RepID=A0ABM6IJR0_9RHOB|nr:MULTISPECIES: sn-glycerol-3-phosphate ABC transporter ATP-binding protein UgpC [Thioclava]AQS49155.1 sn-glycerol-3-phosphate ABC transporter ATP-binding protein UgpC [Thioclava nitratireducens]OWY03085.1 sn-glycerol-3-phosphate ABC transporter ATP-binding protein UgpC [Thioclava sp. IC9]OWY09795.1 sn-glycerol-3-phosphate ABC transporter ATP-binding protein UgpC [Thioclava sp. F42-5]OWY14639.1 sn-glycerol-3-phosphate ABC transporter ATP-binding protein UgpC [Thioclava sp. F34-6]PWE51586.1 sn